MGAASELFHFIYDPEEGTVLGRNAASWAKVSIFYLFYYTFVFGFGYYTLIGYEGMMVTLPDSKSPGEPIRPTTQTRVATPGLATYPAVDTIDIDADRISILNYINSVTEHLKQYAKDDQAKKALVNLGQCSPVCNTGDDCIAPIRISYADGEPCIFYQINKVIGWKPFELQTLDQPFFEPRQNGHSAVSQAVGSDFKQDQVYIYCYDLDLAKGYISETDRIEEITYYSSETALISQGKGQNYGTINMNNWPRITPCEMGFDAKTGETNNNECEFLNPYVAVHFKINPKYQGEQMVNAACQAYAGGMAPSEKTNAAFAATGLRIAQAGSSSMNELTEIYGN